jgi:hydrogenase maturation protease
MRWARPVRVVGVGSPAGDDAVGWAVIDRLRRAGPHEGVEFHRVQGGERLLDLLDGRGTLVLIDAVRSGGTAGTMYQLAWSDGRLGTSFPGTTHGYGAAAALELAAMLGLLPPCFVLGIEIADAGQGAGLSAAVAAAVPEVVRQVTEGLRG